MQINHTHSFFSIKREQTICPCETGEWNSATTCNISVHPVCLKFGYLVQHPTQSYDLLSKAQATHLNDNAIILNEKTQTAEKRYLWSEITRIFPVVSIQKQKLPFPFFCAYIVKKRSPHVLKKPWITTAILWPMPNKDKLQKRYLKQKRFLTNTVFQRYVKGTEIQLKNSYVHHYFNQYFIQGQNDMKQTWKKIM